MSLIILSELYFAKALALALSPIWAIQDSFANCNISVDLDLFNEGIIEYI